jgi:hypothetical protein
VGLRHNPGAQEGKTTMHPMRPIATALLVAGIAVAGCARSQPNQSATPTSVPPGGTALPAAKAPATTTPATADPTAKAEPVALVDGRHPVNIKAVDADRRTVTVDVIQLYFGEQAAREAAKDHQESPPPNDTYIRNVNPRLRTLPVRSEATITCNTLTAGYTGSATKNIQLPLDRLAIVLPRGGAGPFWVTVHHGQVTKIAEQYMP